MWTENEASVAVCTLVSVLEDVHWCLGCALLSVPMLHTLLRWRVRQSSGMHGGFVAWGCRLIWDSKLKCM